MKEVFVQYAAYNLWANRLILTAAEALPEEKLSATVASSFPSINKTVLHLLDAESIWWQRIKLQEQIDRPSQTFSGDIQALSAAVLQQSTQWHTWVAGLTEHGLQHEFFYSNSKKERFKQPVYQMLLHLFNHGTYHRGQLVTLLRELGMETIPNTDFIGWSRGRTHR